MRVIQSTISNLFIKTDFIQGNEDLAAEGHQVVSAEILGKNLLGSLDCKSCHKLNETSIGPSFAAVAQRYKDNAKASDHLIQKVIKGGSGVWGETAMPAHPTLKEGDVKQVVQYILSLAGTANKVKSLPASGSVTPKAPVNDKRNTAFVITASYTDQGKAGVRPLTGSDRVILRSNVLDVNKFKIFGGFTSKDSAGSKYLSFSPGESFVKADQVDLTDIKSIELVTVGSDKAAKYHVEIRTNSASGPIIGLGNLLLDAGKKQQSSGVTLTQKASGKKQDLFIVVRPVDQPVAAMPLLKAIQFNQ